ncbi:4a-hydroxytetrahydrobiopterin dehydratase [Phormidium sp. FACHB-1136]|jgi:4a-hydroxytetrahydrobiopterin dehydratase|uniref:4a-hydroxytetrahydrobiopterin dehydratase n=1 Tax=Phormidium sp. FACHB-1136 TaxID=2692848 RepID=UPI0016836DA3|nr:4a-hydroxytetrahydrobiopterin dehydratase [Phormidium sp. FACHB-1136]MBD2427632.1 4a-hydroxytetrahydrobiopterin dehydratase [Phormidium sp. FACHB-1136]
MATLLTTDAIQSKLSELPDWSLNGKTITCTRTFKNFIAAVDFVNRLVEPAEAAGHHPDLAISYNKVVIELSTHDAGGLTEKDFALAQTISAID